MNYSLILRHAVQWLFSLTFFFQPVYLQKRNTRLAIGKDL